MYDRFIILSDIHANVTALNAVLADIGTRGYHPEAAVSLGDIVNYGMRPNETIDVLRYLPYPLVVNLCGNHEKAVLDHDLTRFSSDRGRQILKYTDTILSENSRNFIADVMNRQGFESHCWNGRHILFVHGSLADPYWGTVRREDISDERYMPYDIVLSGHSHIAQFMEHFFPADNAAMRNRKRTIFVNPGSVGQPRNHNPQAQYVYMELSSGIIHFNAVEYDIASEQCLYSDQVDSFYRERLALGI